MAAASAAEGPMWRRANPSMGSVGAADCEVGMDVVKGFRVVVMAHLSELKNSYLGAPTLLVCLRLLSRRRTPSRDASLQWICGSVAVLLPESFRGAVAPSASGGSDLSRDEMGPF